jgi:hypothetical protein
MDPVELQIQGQPLSSDNFEPKIIWFSNFSWIPIFFSNFSYNCFNILDLRNLKEQVKKAFCFKNWSDLSLFE